MSNYLKKIFLRNNDIKPNRRKIKKMWKSMELIRKSDFHPSTDLLIASLTSLYRNGDAQIHKYKIQANADFDWFANRNRLNEIEFIKNIIFHPDLSTFRDDLGIEIPKKKAKMTLEAKYHSTIFSLSGVIANILYHGGAYTFEKALPEDAWSIATEFVENTFQNRFIDILFFSIDLTAISNWFFDLDWDHSWLFFDKKNYEIILINTTDTD